MVCVCVSGGVCGVGECVEGYVVCLCVCGGVCGVGECVEGYVVWVSIYTLYIVSVGCVIKVLTQTIRRLHNTPQAYQQ